MRVLFTLLPAIFFSHHLLSQSCNCPYDDRTKAAGEPSKLFLFSNKKTIGLCGEYSIEKNDTTYSGFTLRRCDENKVIFNKTHDETGNYKIKKIADTLLVEEIEGLPVGKNFSTVWEPFYIDQFFFKGQNLQERGFYRKDIKKYSKEQIKVVLQQYRKLTKSDYDQIIHTADMLFWAYISGNKDAEVYLKSMPEKFGPFDGGIAEEWDDISATYEGWKEKNKHK